MEMFTALATPQCQDLRFEPDNPIRGERGVEGANRGVGAKVTEACQLAHVSVSGFIRNRYYTNRSCACAIVGAWYK